MKLEPAAILNPSAVGSSPKTPILIFLPLPTMAIAEARFSLVSVFSNLKIDLLRWRSAVLSAIVCAMLAVMLNPFGFKLPPSVGVVSTDTLAIPLPPPALAVVCVVPSAKVILPLTPRRTLAILPVYVGK